MPKVGKRIQIQVRVDEEDLQFINFLIEKAHLVGAKSDRSKAIRACLKCCQHNYELLKEYLYINSLHINNRKENT